jgi:hypothetical protein
VHIETVQPVCWLGEGMGLVGVEMGELTLQKNTTKNT